MHRLISVPLTRARERTNIAGEILVLRQDNLVCRELGSQGRQVRESDTFVTLDLRKEAD